MCLSVCICVPSSCTKHLEPIFGQRTVLVALSWLVLKHARTHARSPVRAELGVCCTSLLMSLCLVTTVIPTSNMPLCSDEMVDWRHYIIWRTCSLETHKQDSVLSTHWVMLHSLQWLSRGMNDKLILYYVSRPRALWV